MTRDLLSGGRDTFDRHARASIFLRALSFVNRRSGVQSSLARGGHGGGMHIGSSVSRPFTSPVGWGRIANRPINATGNTLAPIAHDPSGSTFTGSAMNRTSVSIRKTCFRDCLGSSQSVLHSGQRRTMPHQFAPWPPSCRTMSAYAKYLSAGSSGASSSGNVILDESTGVAPI
jgi:hypothetical protein